jgi:hypothetical protein
VNRISSVIRYVWTAPTTALGLVLVLTGLWRARVWVVDGVVEAHGPALDWLLSHFTLTPGGAAALTLGHVVIARDSWSLESTRAHERVHVLQCELWGPLFVPAYLAASLLATLRGGNFYFDNRFEIEAFHALETSPSPRSTACSRVASHPLARGPESVDPTNAVERFVLVEHMAGLPRRIGASQE